MLLQRLSSCRTKQRLLGCFNGSEERVAALAEAVILSLLLLRRLEALGRGDEAKRGVC
jgi:hypothetical protein